MANETVTKSSRFYCVSLTPDICKTPVGASTPPIPYNVIGEFSQAESVSRNVKAQGAPVYLHRQSFIPTVKGDHPGTAGGIKSGTHAKKVESKDASSTFRANKLATIQTNRQVWMNDRNTVGMVYERGAQAAKPRVQPAAAAGVMDSVADALKPMAQKYKDTASDALHQFGSGAMQAGSKVLAGSAVAGVAGAGIAATGVGVPVGAVVTAGAAAGVTVGGAVTTVGATADGAATLLDTAAGYVLAKTRPDLGNLVVEAGKDMLQRAVLGRASTLVNWVKRELPLAKRLLEGGAAPGKKSAKMPAQPPKKPPPPPNDGKDGGKTRKQKQEKSDKPSDCCPKNAAPGGKPVSSRHPVHFGTGEEVLYQTDFVIDAPIPLAWTRCYRSGSECEDWGMLGARWAVPYASAISVVEAGMVYHDDSGRAVRLPYLADGQQYDSRMEGFILARTGEDAFTLTWRDGSTDVFSRSILSGWLPHGFDGINAMLRPGAPVQAERFVLARSAGRDGRGITVERFEQAQPGAPLLRIRSDSGAVIEAIRDEMRFAGTDSLPRIGRVEEVRPDGQRVCHVRYGYEPELDGPDAAPQPGALPARCNLIRQTNLLGSARSYTYRHHLLVGYTDYTGFRHGLSWVSLDCLRQRWAGSELDDAELAARHPVTLANSYQARAVETTTADGCDTVRIAYLDADTTRVTDAAGGVLDYTFDANWLATDVRRIHADGTAQPLGRRVWDRDGMLLAEIDGAGNATRYRYDAAGNVVAVIDALGNAQQIAYDGHNQAIALTDALGHVTRLEYDEAGRLAATIDPLGHVTRHRYDREGRLIELTDAKGGVKRLDYDRAGRLCRYTDCSGHPTSYAYDDAGRLTSVTDALSQVTRYDYDRLGRLHTVTQPDGTQERYAYDAENRLLAHTDALGQQTRYRYNGHGLPVERIDALGHTVRYRYDSALRLAELVNANGESYLFDYDAEGNLAGETGFDGKVTRYAYDAAGQLTGTVCAGRQTTLLRDRLGQLQSKVTADDAVRFAFDALGRMTAVASRHAAQRFRYDPLGRLVEERSAYYLQGQHDVSTGDGKPDAAFVMTHAYDELGNRIQTVLPHGRRVDILRYGAGHWHGTLWHGRTVVDLERDELHREAQRHYGAGPDRLSATRSYDPQSRLLAITLRRGAQTTSPLSDRRFRYDRGGNLLETFVLGTRPGGAHRIAYEYDPLGRLLRAAQPALDEVFAFDPADNLIGQDGEAKGNRLHRFQGARYQYDEQGNLRSREGGGMAELALQYDAENRLTHALRSGPHWRYTGRYVYDAFSRRIAKHVTYERWQPGRNPALGSPVQRTRKTTLFVWDGDLLTQEIDDEGTTSYLYEPESFVPLARVVTGWEQADPSQLGERALHVHLPCVEQWQMPLDASDAAAHVRAFQIDTQLRSEERHQTAWFTCRKTADEVALSDALYHYHCDQLGTPQELRDQDGGLVWAGRYRAWGEVERTDIAKIAQPLRFQGQYEDNETGIFYNRYRFYDPKSGRYLTNDPICLLGGLNQYAYSPSPTGSTDPRGLATNCSKHPGCSPCAGKNPIAEAMSQQGTATDPTNPYIGVDAYEEMVLKKGTILYSLYPGQGPGFAVTNHTLEKARGNAKRYHELTQVKSTNLPPGFSMRTQVKVYRVREDICVARGKALANTQFGSGGATQYYVPISERLALTEGIIRKI